MTVPAGRNAARLLRVFKLLRLSHEIMVVFGGLIHSMKAMIYVDTLFAITVYAAAIFFNSVIEPAKYESTFLSENSDFSMTELFGTLGNSMLTRVYLGLLSDWELTFKALYTYQPHVASFGIIYIMFVCFGIASVRHMTFSFR